MNNFFKMSFHLSGYVGRHSFYVNCRFARVSKALALLIQLQQLIYLICVAQNQPVGIRRRWHMRSNSQINMNAFLTSIEDESMADVLKKNNPLTTTKLRIDCRNGPPLGLNKLYRRNCANGGTYEDINHKGDNGLYHLDWHLEII